MAQNLWELRQKQKMTVKQLAGKSGVKAGNIYAYESGEAIKIADLGKLAKALYVDSSEIKIESEPIPKKKPAPPKPVKPATPPPAAKAAEARATAEMALLKTSRAFPQVGPSSRRTTLLFKGFSGESGRKRNGRYRTHRQSN
ncbi:MAG: helix-turn-helix domain-containing protein [Chloroflexi bacterium]|nr:helix-turn-helix domain-containing protein [Chloroflexota bacterium]